MHQTLFALVLWKPESAVCFDLTRLIVLTAAECQSCARVKLASCRPGINTECTVARLWIRQPENDGLKVSLIIVES